MSLPIEKHIEFYKAEYAVQEQDWLYYVQSPIKTLIASKEREMYAGFASGIERHSGLLLLKVRNESAPRLNQPYFLSVVLEPKTPPKGWSITYQQFREKHHIDYYEGIGGTIVPINYWKTEGNFTFFLCESLDDELIPLIEQECFSKSIYPLVLLAESDPPLDYLVNLKEFLEKNKSNKIVNSTGDNRSALSLQNLDNGQDIIPFLLKDINEKEITLIQGPPGTGKSYTAAAIANEYINNNKSVVICSLANKGLIEIIGQNTLKEALNARKVHKTSLSSLEKKEQPKLKKATEIIPIEGKLLLTTYYSLSKYFKAYKGNKYRFDLLIIEEASQAFLATIAMFIEISERTLIIGDFKQIPPVVRLEKRQINRIHPNLNQAINGLETFTLNKTESTYRFTKTRRLTASSANLTGLFYENSLESISSLTLPVANSSKYKNIFNDSGNPTIVFLPKESSNPLSSFHFVDKLLQIVMSLLETSNECTVAILASKRDMEAVLIREFYSKYGKLKRVHFSTVHRAQGLTVDYCFFYMPLEATHMDLNPNLFNVATSRARKGTCILTKDSMNMMVNTSAEVQSFLKGCQDVTKTFTEFMEVEF
ncbi:AAA domain-containing protein [uncultured Arcticibacterium sp.]|uniref:AAA domain-containing protein n=1 Tax=uncultured Arcticibacterium sp. TaxID=2173042 RepID=UPI0030FC973B